MASKIFVNYRREDSIALAGRLHDRLAEAFGRDNLFMDVDNIPVGIDFEQYLNNQVAQCDVMLSVIGPNWLNAKDETNQRRLDKTNFGSDAEQLITKMREALALGRPERTQDFVFLLFNTHSVAAFLFNIAVFLLALTFFFMESGNYAGALAAMAASLPFSLVGQRTLARNESVRMFGLVTAVGGLLATVAIIVSGQFYGVGLFDPTVQNASMGMAFFLLFSAMFFGQDQYWKPPYGAAWLQKGATRIVNSRWLAGLSFLAPVLFVSATPAILHRLMDSEAAAAALVVAQLLVTGRCYVQYRKALVAI